MDTPSLQAALTTVLEDQLSEVRQLNTCLARERESLLGRDPDTLAACVETKRTHMAQLEALDAKRTHLFNELGYTDGPHDANTSRVWQALLDELQACQTANETNGAVVRLQSSHVQKALDTLTGTDATPTYAANGEPDGVRNSRTITRV